MSNGEFSVIDATPRRVGCRPNGICDVELDDDMIKLRDGIAKGLGYVLRQCSLGGTFECWEHEALTYNYRGKMASPYHNVRASEATLKGQRVMLYGWPGDAEKAAWAIDKGRRAKK